MKILSEKANKDGSVTFEMDFEEEEIQILLQYAVENILREYVNKESKSAKKSKVVKPIRKGSKDAKKPRAKK
jgi:hypothetical protein